ncbi:protein YgfX [Neptuniibacter sp. QD48_11]|uniref:protein YgfX n=1 Tax=Neptuniibacter sp. QD48_11 TaxID=3398211 RepID=UPI0039F53CD8
MFSLNNEPISPSCTLLVIYSGVHLSACFALFYSAIPLHIAVLATLALLCSFLFYLNERVLLTSPLSIVAITWNGEEGVISLLQRNQQRIDVTRIKQKVITPFVIVMLCNSDSRFYTIPVVIMRQSFNENAFRRLRILLLYSPLYGLNSNEN